MKWKTLPPDIMRMIVKCCSSILHIRKAFVLDILILYIVLKTKERTHLTWNILICNFTLLSLQEVALLYRAQIIHIVHLIRNTAVLMVHMAIVQRQQVVYSVSKQWVFCLVDHLRTSRLFLSSEWVKQE